MVFLLDNQTFFAKAVPPPPISSLTTASLEPGLHSGYGKRKGRHSGHNKRPSFRTYVATITTGHSKLSPFR
ncbi:hypothetical protein Pyn_16737 [Prunus yedoensis var. nudiflora]|uniref:Uncharacterized protein n=1 Tax=Prunus yedoensis var. nudiflora TaxID=2094558 RepID=A0A314U7X7_PRUYE|nr:hypothetical protein Pyn_16737 [Prunus yedoensis var. nudiflora]